MIRIAILVNEAEELVITIPMLGFIIDIVVVLTADPDPIEISVIINNIFFLFKLLYTYLNFKRF